MSSIEKEVQSLINTLGFLENGVYYPEPDCFQNVRDLVRYLHRDDRLFTVRRLCNDHNIVKNDLVPIMRSEELPEELFDVALRITVNLCQPTLMVFNNERPIEPAEWQIFFQLETSLLRTLVAFCDGKIFKVFAKKVGDYFALDWEDRTEQQRIFVERIFLLLRYVFAIGMESVKHLSVPEVDHSVRERVIVNFFSSGIDEIFLKLSQNSSEKDFCSYIVAILALAFKTLDARSIAHEGEAEKQKKDKEEFEREQAEAIEAVKQAEESSRRELGKRSFLNGTFLVKGVKALNPEKEFILKGSLVNKEKENASPIEALVKRKKPKNPPRTRRVDDLEVTAEECSTQNLQELNPGATLAIKQFCTRLLLEGKYNRLMRTTREIAFHNRASSKMTELHYLTLTSFMLAFTRHSRFSCQHISATFSVDFFHQINTFLTDCFDKMKMDKANIRRWALSAQYGVSAFREITIMLNSMSNSIHPEEREQLRDFCHKIFQVEEYRELAIGILVHLSPAGTSHKMLQDLILANHYFLHLIEKSVKEGELVRVQRRRRQRKRKRAQKRRQKEQEKTVEKVMKEDELDALWREISEELASALRGELQPNEDASPVNMLIKADDEQLQQFARLQVQVMLRTRRVLDAVGIYRNARVLWPETGTFGDDQLSAEDEQMALSEIFQADMRALSKQYTEAMEQAYGKRNGPEELDREEEESEEEEGGGGENEEEEEGGLDLREEEADFERLETTFDFPAFVSSMAKPAVINWYIFSLRRFRTNPKEVNLAILKFFHRIAFDLKSPARLYTASLFKLFSEINREVCRGRSKEQRSQHPHFRLHQFGYHLLRKFFTHFEERGGGILTCELLFSKSAKEAYEVEYGYGSME